MKCNYCIICYFSFDKMDIEALYSNPAIPGSLGGLERAYREFKKIIPKLTRKMFKNGVRQVSHIPYIDQVGENSNVKG